jgi:hypothetical protein
MSILFYAAPFSFEDDFNQNTDIYGIEPNNTRWSIIGDSNDVFINNGQLRTQVAGTGKNNGVESNFKISGDFDLRVDFNVTQGYSSGSGWAPFFEIHYVDNIQYRMRIYVDSITDHVFVMQWQTGGSISSTLGTAKASSGTYRVTRTSNNWQSSVDKGSGFINVGGLKSIGSNDVLVKIRTQVWGSVNAIVDFDNFTIESGEASLI